MISMPYNKDKSMAVKAIPGQRWDRDRYCWWVPDAPDSIECLRTIFGQDMDISQKEIEPPYVKTLRLEMQSRHYSQSTIDTYTRYALDLIQHTRKEPDQITEADITEYLAHHRNERDSSPSTINLAYSGIKFFFIHIYRKNITPRVERARRTKHIPVVLSTEEVKRILESTRNLKDRAILTLIYSAGLRVGETSRLKISDLDRQRMTIHIHEGKGRKDRYTILSPKALDVIDRYIKWWSPRTYLFEGYTPGQPIQIRTIQRMFWRAKNRAKIKKRASVHTLRHSFATHLVDKGTDIHHIQKLLGHKSIKTTLVYLHISNDALTKVISPLEQLEILQGDPRIDR